MRTLAADTSPEVEHIQLDLMRRIPPWRKLQLAGGLNRMVRMLALRGLQRRYPAASDRELRRYLAEQRLGPTLAGRIDDPCPPRNSTMLNEPFDVTLLVTRQLESLDIPYVIGGSIASIVYGEYRSTNDADVLAAIQSQHIEPLVASLAGDFIIHAEEIRDALQYAATRPDPGQGRPSFALLHLDTLFKVDVCVSTGRPFEQSELARRIPEIVAIEPEQRAYIATAEDMVLAKLEWYEPGNRVSDQQWRDILAILKLQGPTVDRAYMDLWARELGVADMLARALTGAGLEP